VQESRKVPDREILNIFSGEIRYAEIDGPGLKIFNAVFGSYWRMLKSFLNIQDM